MNDDLFSRIITDSINFIIKINLIFPENSVDKRQYTMSNNKENENEYKGAHTYLPEVGLYADVHVYDYFSGEHGHGQGHYGGYDESRPSTPVLYECATGASCAHGDASTPDQVRPVFFEPSLTPVTLCYSRALGDILTDEQPFEPFEPSELKRCHSRYSGEILTDEEEAFESASNAERQSTNWSWSRLTNLDSASIPPIPAPIMRQEPMTLREQADESDIESDITWPPATLTDLDGKKSSDPDTQTTGEDCDCEGEDDMPPLMDVMDEDARVEEMWRKRKEWFDNKVELENIERQRKTKSCLYAVLCQSVKKELGESQEGANE